MLNVFITWQPLRVIYNKDIKSKIVDIYIWFLN